MKFIIILGNKLTINGTMSKSLIGRLNCAIAIYDISDIIIVCGGKVGNNVHTEACVMNQYLIKHHILQDNIICEDKSTSTIENIKNMYRLLPKQRTNILIITSHTHMTRTIKIVKYILKNKYNSKHKIEYLSSQQ